MEGMFHVRSVLIMKLGVKMDMLTDFCVDVSPSEGVGRQYHMCWCVGFPKKFSHSSLKAG